MTDTEKALVVGVTVKAPGDAARYTSRAAACARQGDDQD